jgi:hypothetical protein
LVPVVSRAELSVAVEATGSMDSDTNTSSTDEDSQMNTMTNVEVNTGVGINLLGGDNQIEGSMQSDSNTSSEVDSSTDIMSSAQVNSQADLDLFVKNIKTQEKDVSKVDIDSSENKSDVKVVYNHKAKLFGFIPVTIKSTTEVGANDNSEVEVSSRLSWWSFMVTKQNYAKDNLEAKIKSNSVIKANAKVDASASEKAKVTEAVISEIQANANASMLVDSSTNASVNY